MIENKDWQEVVDAPVGHIFKDWFEDKIRCLITKGPLALCAYLGIPESHPIAGFDCTDLPLRVHGELSVSRSGCYESLPENYYWYGWNYGHPNGVSVRTDTYNHPNAKAWTVEMVEKEIKEAALHFKQLVLFTEKMVLKHEKTLMEKINEELIDFLFKQHKAYSNYNAPDAQKGYKDGLLSAYNEIYRIILEIEDKENSFIDDDIYDIDEIEVLGR